MSNTMTERERQTFVMRPIDELEKMSHEERLIGKYYDRTRHWFTFDEESGFKHSLVNLLKNKKEAPSIFSEKPLIKLTSDFIRHVRLFASDTEFAKKEASGIWRDLFGKDNPKSVINAKKGVMKGEIESVLKNAISILTFVNLIAVADPSLKSKLKLAEIVPDPSVTVLNDVNLIVRLGDRNPKNGKEVVRLINLSTTERSEISVLKVDNLGKMNEFAARMMSKNNTIETSIFAIGVPAYNTKVVRNVFGIIQGEHKDEVRSSFLFQAKGQGLIK